MERINVDNHETNKMILAESQALEIVGVMKKFIDILRTVGEFNPDVRYTTILKNEQRNSGTVEQKVQCVKLYSIMEKEKIASDVLKICSGTRNVNSKWANKQQKGKTPSSLLSLQPLTPWEERYRVVFNILLPLIRELTRCYAILDQYSPPKEVVPTEEKTINNTGGTKKKRRKPPPPPPGLLSIRNYTDIAIVLEFLVCNSILPNLESNILLPIRDRIKRQLPKSLTGRVPKYSLLWACCIKEKGIQVNNSSTYAVTILKELKSTIICIGNLIQLDRFKPMLQPRHIPDLYAAIFQVEKLSTVSLRISKESSIASSKEELNDNCNSPSDIYVDDDDKVDYDKYSSRILPCNKNHQNRQQRKKESLAVDENACLQVQALQQLLLHGMKTPKWLRNRVSTLLTNVACYDLSTLIQVFVHSAPRQHKESAILRLANTLGKTPYKNRNDYYRRLCKQSITFLNEVVKLEVGDCISFSSSNFNYVKNKINNISAQQELNIHTIWAVLDQLPKNVFHDEILRLLCDDLLSEKKVYQTVLCILYLLYNVPFSIFADKTKIYTLFLLPLSSTNTNNIHCDDLIKQQQQHHFNNSSSKSTILSLLLRIASVKSIMKSDIKEITIYAIQLLLQTMEMSVISPLSIKKTKIKNNSTEGGNKNKGESSKKVGNNLNEKDEKGGKTATITDSIALMLLYCLVPCEWDLEGYSYNITSVEEGGKITAATTANNNRNNGQEVISIEIIDPAADIAFFEKKIREALEQRAKVIIKDIIAPFMKLDAISSVSRPEEESYNKIAVLQLLPSSMFHVLLWVYFSSSPPSYSIFHDNFKIFQISSMMLLPQLCECCSIESLLLGGKEENGLRILKMMKLVFACAAHSCYDNINDWSNSNDENESSIPNFRGNEIQNKDDKIFLHSNEYLSTILAIDHERLEKIEKQEPHTTENFIGDNDSHDRTFLLSIVSILLSLLITMLELGTTKKRSQEEEDAFDSLILLLRIFAESSSFNHKNNYNHRNNQDMEDGSCNHGMENQMETIELSAVYAEISEMASHAMALLVSRKASSLFNKNSTATLQKGEHEEEKQNHDAEQQLTVGDFFTLTMSRVEVDLKSMHPPLRARGIVTLRKLMHDERIIILIKEEKSEKIRKNHKHLQKALIIDMEEDKDTKNDQENVPSILKVVINNILRLSIIALKDKESYVYLAAIQTIVAVADACPKDVIPLLSLIVVTCVFKIPSSITRTANSENDGLNAILSLEPSQAIKLAEALVFIIRRRAAILYEHISSIIELIILGEKDESDKNTCNHSNDNNQRLDDIIRTAHDIQMQTHDYFVNEKLDDDDGEILFENDLKRQKEERTIRINTGGPLFETEEEDSVRAARISILGEIVSCVNPSLTAKYCSIFIQVSIFAIRLDSSRPVRRSGAFLARELYRSLLCEQENMFEIIGKNCSTSNIREEMIKNSFSIPMAVELVESEEEILATALSRCAGAYDLKDIAKNKYRVYDTATVSRCHEALELRESASSILATAKVIAESKKRNRKVPNILLEPSANSSSGNQSTDVVQIMRGLRINPNYLELEH